MSTGVVIGRLEEAVGPFGWIYADPPWQYSNASTRGAADDHYGTMSVESLCALPVGRLAAEQSHLHLWTTTSFLREAFTVMEAWGFEYKSQFVWVKPQMGMGNYWRISHEILLLGLRGGLQFAAHDQPSWASLPRGKHSAKPELVRMSVEKVSPGPYLELFGRRQVEGWTVWGNQVERMLYG